VVVIKLQHELPSILYENLRPNLKCFHEFDSAICNQIDKNKMDENTSEIQADCLTIFQVFLGA